MKRHFLIILIVFFALQTYAQTKYEKGYFINNQDQRVDCLIKNADWRNTPNTFDYKLAENEDEINAPIDSVKEFGFLGVSKYVRADVEIEKATNQIRQMNISRQPVYKKERLFLKVAIEGEASLFVYDEDVSTFFFKNDTSSIKQLIYKQYLTEDGQIAKNFDFRKQLFSSLNSSRLSQDDFSKLNYELKELVNVFRKYNSNSTSVEFQKKEKKGQINFNIRSGINYSSFKISNTEFSRKGVDFGSQLLFRVGAEVEFVLGFGNNKWAVPIAVDYQSFKKDGVSKENETVVTDIKAVAPSVGLRYYIFLPDNSKFYVNGLVDYNLFFDSKIQYANWQPLKLTPAPNLIFGIGYKRQRFSAEFRYDMKKNLLFLYRLNQSSFSNKSLTFAYTLF